MKKVACYIRVSTMEQAEHGYSVSEQTDKLKKYCDLHDLKIYETYTDGGFSGSNLKRPAMKQLIADAKDKKFDSVLVWKLDRLSRKTQDVLYLVQDVFRNNGIDFVSMKENIDTDSAIGNMFLTVLAAIAEFERETITERMKMGKIGRAKSGKATGWNWSPFGYSYNKDTGNYEIESIEADVVRDMFNRYIGGMSITKLRDTLNNEGHIGKDIPWSYRTIRQILDNPSYAGYVKLNGKTYEGKHEALITKEMFEATQIELDKRQKKAYENNNNPRPFQSKYMLAGIGRCGYCGAPLKSMLGTIRKDGSRDRKYQCVNRVVKKSSAKKMGVTVYNNGEKCSSPFYMAPDIEAQVIAAVAELQDNPDLINELVADNGAPIADTDALQKRIAELDGKIKKLSDLYMNDFLTMDELKAKTEAFQLEQNSIEAKIKQANDYDAEHNISAIVAMLAKHPNIKQVDYEEQKQIVNMLIRKVDVTAEKVRVHWVF